MLLEKGADVTATDVNGTGSLMWMSKNDGDYVDIVDTLRRAGADPYAVSIEGKSTSTAQPATGGGQTQL